MIARPAVNYRYTDTELKQLLDSMTVLIDTREQAADHVIDYFDDKGVKYESRKLEVGDYSFYLPADQELGINRPIFFDKQLTVERKGSGASGLDELTNNFCKGRARFRNEMIRGKEGTKIILLIEDADFGDLVNGNYRSQMNSKSLMGSLLAWKFRYNLDIQFISKQLSGLYIRYTFQYYLREYLKR